MDEMQNMLAWYRRRVDALERLAANYRFGRSRCSEQLLDELAATQRHIGPSGQWLGPDEDR